MDYPDNPFLAEKPTKPVEVIIKVGPTEYYPELMQNTDEWLKLRCGMITASNMSKILTPTLKVANNDKTRKFFYEVAAERIAGKPAPHFMSYDMERGHLEESEASKVYNDKIAPAVECGFAINRELGFPVGFSPDRLVGDDGFLECKSRLAKFQVETIFDHIVMAEEAKTPIPVDFMMQVQTGFFVTKREWCDFISYSNGLNMVVIRCEPIAEYQAAIESALIDAEKTISRIVRKYKIAVIDPKSRVFPVEWIDHHEEISA